MPALYTITEPHPTVAKNSYTHSGRGGAGNFFRAPQTTAPSGVPTPAATGPPSTGRFYSGRGGAGNAHASAERPVMSFDEEFTRAEVREKTATISHVGRGGAGNISSTGPSSTKKNSTELSRRDSNSTNGSAKSGFWGRISSIGH
ncbi:hypothetical protein QBC40DRAFT_82705 [Triangularia verruculosa]|uniref:Uncharacterized protein n=1 Tax=Triangularia verruculosa TaxID=2587418 RepID=A0AAN6XEY0_9PEZI|nr:hypothetical protein QBC40DRAFT_82705 [Triangularia verruculosa]